MLTEVAHYLDSISAIRELAAESIAAAEGKEAGSILEGICDLRGRLRRRVLIEFRFSAQQVVSLLIPTFNGSRIISSIT